MYKKKYLTKKIIKKALKKVLLEDYGIDLKDTKSKKQWSEKLSAFEYEFIIFNMYLDTYILEQINHTEGTVFNDEEFYFDIVFDDSITNDDFIDYVYKEILNNHKDLQNFQSYYKALVRNFFESTVIYLLLGLLLILIILLLINWISASVASSLGIDNFYGDLLGWILLFLSLSIYVKYLDK